MRAQSGAGPGGKDAPAQHQDQDLSHPELGEADGGVRLQDRTISRGIFPFVFSLLNDPLFSWKGLGCCVGEARSQSISGETEAGDFRAT